MSAEVGTAANAATEAANRAAEQLYRQHRRDVYRFVLRAVRNREDAEDVTQVTFMNAYKALQRGAWPDRPRAWLLTIAQNVCRRRYRRDSAKPQEINIAPEPAVAAENDSETPSAGEIVTALNDLPENQRRALFLREVQGKAYAEVGAELGLSASATQALLFRARRSFRERLEAGARALVALPGASLHGLVSGSSTAGRASLAAKAGLAAKAATVVGAAAIGTGVALQVANSAPPARNEGAANRVVDERTPRATRLSLDPRSPKAKTDRRARGPAAASSSKARGKTTRERATNPASTATSPASQQPSTGDTGSLLDEPLGGIADTELPLPDVEATTLPLPDLEPPVPLPDVETVPLPDVETVPLPDLGTPSVSAVPTVTIP